MAVNLLEMVKEGLPPNFASMAGGLLGESGASTGTALSALLPAVLAGVARKGSTETGAQGVLAMLNNPALDTSALGNLGSIFGAGGSQASSMMSTGAALASSIFGDKLGALSGALGSVAGLAKPQSAQSLVALVVPVVLTFLKRFVSTSGTTAGGLASLLGSQGEFLKGALDSRLTGALGFPDPSAMVSGLMGKAGAAVQATADRVGSAGAAAATAAASTATAATTAGRSAFARWWPWLVGAIIVLFILSRCMNAQKAPEPAPAPPPAAAPAPTPAPAPAPAAAVPTALPAKVYFDTGSTTLGDAAKPVIDAIAALVKQDGGKMNVTGYADSTGDPAQNAEIAKNRAKAVRDALVAAGVPDDSLVLAPPASFTGTGGDAEARRVEVSKAQ